MRPFTLLFDSVSRAHLRVAYAFAGIAAGAVSYAFGQSQNFHVFAAAALALVRGDDLYVLRAADYFKYSPTFALLFLPFTWVPGWLAASLWSLLNFVVAFVGIDRAVRDPRQKRIALAIALAGIALTTDGDQSNLLVAGGWFLAFQAFEESRTRTGAAWILLGGFVKLFPVLGAVFALFQPRRMRVRALVSLAMAALFWAALPLLVCSPRTLAFEYASWRHLVSWDLGNRGWSVLPLLHDGLHLSWANHSMQIAGACAQAIPIVLGLRFGTDAAWRRTLACSLLTFAVLFNHRTEYASFVLSAIAVGIWCATTRTGTLARVLVLLSILAPGPFFARPDPSVGGFFTFLAAHREFHPLRVVPLLALWLFMQRDLLKRFVRVELAHPVRVPDLYASSSGSFDRGSGR